jgi:DNA-binding transcriptional MerR regulator
VQISELAKRADLPMRTVRYYADRKLIRAARRSAGGQRLFDDEALKQLHFVRRMQRLGLGLSEIAQLVRATEELSCRPSSKVIVSRLRTHLTAVETRLQELDGVRHELSALLTANEVGCSDELCLCSTRRVPTTRR